jgi:hypothetical protein
LEILDGPLPLDQLLEEPDARGIGEHPKEFAFEYLEAVGI